MQLVYVINQWLKTREKGRESCAVFMDFVKDFDRVWHPGLLFKLSSTGASLDCTAWFRSYLSDRTILFVLAQLCLRREIEQQVFLTDTIWGPYCFCYS